MSLKTSSKILDKLLTLKTTVKVMLSVYFYNVQKPLEDGQARMKLASQCHILNNQKINNTGWTMNLLIAFYHI
jgi:hypothetical protein